MINGKKSPKMNPEEMRLKGLGWDQAIDTIVLQVLKQIEGLRNYKKENPDGPDIRLTVDVCAKLVENLKKAKGNVAEQQFGVDEVREIVDQFTGDIISTNVSAMTYFDENWFPKYLSGEVEKKVYTPKKEPKPEN